MHMTCADAKSYLEEFLPLIKNIKNDRKIVIAPPFTAISSFSDWQTIPKSLIVSLATFFNALNFSKDNQE